MKWESSQGSDWDDDMPQCLESLTLGNVLMTNEGVEAQSTVRELVLETWCQLMVARPGVLGYILKVYPEELSDRFDEGHEKARS